LKPGEAVFWESDTATHVFQVMGGCLRLYRILPDGRRAITGFAFCGELLGTSLEGSYLHTAEAVTPVRLRRLPGSRFHALVDACEHLRPQLFARMCAEMRAAQQHIVALGRLGAEERVVRFLLSTAWATGADRTRPITIKLPMSRLDIADYLGLTIETVCRTLTKLKHDRFIALDGRHTILLRRMADLRELACDIDTRHDDHSTAAVRSH
jgi:CRP/FNR family transcriptional regulator